MLANVIGAIAVVLIFSLLVHVTRLADFTRQAIAVSKHAAAVVRDPARTDDEKEREVQGDTIKLLRLLSLLIAGSVVALAVPVALLWLASRFGWVGFDATMALFVRWDFLVAATVVGVAAYLVVVKWSARRS